MHYIVALALFNQSECIVESKFQPERIVAASDRPECKLAPSIVAIHDLSVLWQIEITEHILVQHSFGIKTKGRHLCSNKKSF